MRAGGSGGTTQIWVRAGGVVRGRGRKGGREGKREKAPGVGGRHCIGAGGGDGSGATQIWIRAGGVARRRGREGEREREREREREGGYFSLFMKN
ncbi:hypothetical protein TIFTF001_026442 [Ficus carica]|uniref:Uncharacterized protein n=1 Tax=Ficus carica TaxID=3494 RepID=A0AA88IWW4_FICCA|nr:hypothetical protein TIFTF001_026442 [Ficus carica]